MLGGSGGMLVRSIGVIAAMFVFGIASAHAQTPTPDPAPVPAPPAAPPPSPTPTVVERARVDTTEDQAKEPRTHKRRHHSPARFTAIHPTFAEEIPRAVSRPAAAAPTQTRLPVRFAVSERSSSPLVLLLVLLLGVGSLVVAAVSSVPEHVLHEMPQRLANHQGEFASVCLALLFGLAIGLPSVLVVQ
jgi:hypothetical protein